jgi:hypothetical protein
MKKISFVVGQDYQNNRIFDLSNKILNRDNCLYPFSLLKEEFETIGYELITSDILNPENADMVIYNEMPKDSTSPNNSFLLIFETELIRPDNWDLNKHKKFKKIFTWNDDFVDNKKYIKFNFANVLTTSPVGVLGRNNLATLISGNKTSNHPKELYSERLKTIRWFEKNHPLDFHYYGMGWDYSFSLWFQKVFKKLKVLKYLPKNPSPCYRGRVDEKNATLKKYKFAICYENAKQINGYITEKIFDCFFAGCIPVYWGPDNITNFIPIECFINRREFKTHEELYDYLKSLNDDEILKRQIKINEYLNSEAAQMFTDKFFVKNIIENMINE